MQPELFSIPGLGITIHTYGLMLVVAFIAAAMLARRLAARHSIDPIIFLNAMVIALIAGLVGARISHVLENLGDYIRLGWGRGLWEMCNVSNGGLTYYGGFLLAFPTLVWYALRKKVPLGTGMDVVAPCLMVAYGFGRIGCFLNGCCYGAVCPASAPWAVRFPYASIAYVTQVQAGQINVPAELLQVGPRGGPALVRPAEMAANSPLRPLADAQTSLPVLPTQLFSAFTAFLLAGVLLAYMTLPHAAGRAFALMCMLEGASRFLLELLRTEPPVLGGWTLGMITGVVVAAMGVMLWWEFGRENTRVALTLRPHKKAQMVSNSVTGASKEPTHES